MFSMDTGSGPQVERTGLWCLDLFLSPSKDELSFAVQASICGGRFASAEANVETRDTGSNTVSASTTHGLSSVAYPKYQSAGSKIQAAQVGTFYSHNGALDMFG